MDRPVSEPGTRILSRCVAFAGALRDNDFTIGPTRTSDAAAILASPLGIRPAVLRQAWRALFCADHAQWVKFDAIFDAHWLDRGVKRVMKVGGTSQAAGPRTLRQLADSGAPHGLPNGADDAQRQPDDRCGNPADGRGRHEGASRSATTERTDFRYMSDPEKLAAAREAAARLAAVMRTKRSHRARTVSRGARIDIRGTIRASLSRGGVLLDRVYKTPRQRALKLVILLDASGSMSVYTAVFTRFIVGVTQRFRQFEAFLFHTRLVQISSALRDGDAQRALDRLSLLAEGVGGGTRIGECLAIFNRWHAKRVLTSRCVVMIVSDGYDTGEPGELGSAMHALSRRCRRLVWLNPMLGWSGYEPVARGMAEARPYLDLFAPAHDLASLRLLEPYLARL